MSFLNIPIILIYLCPFTSVERKLAKGQGNNFAILSEPFIQPQTKTYSVFCSCFSTAVSHPTNTSSQPRIPAPTTPDIQGEGQTWFALLCWTVSKSWRVASCHVAHINPSSPNNWSKTNFSFFNLWPAMWNGMEKLAGDLLFGLKLVNLSILPMLFILFV